MLYNEDLDRVEDTMNQMMLAGNLGADPEVRFTSSGKKVTTMRVATRARKGGQEDTIWFRVSVWGEEHDKFIAHLKKGSAIIVFGELQKPEIFTDREGRSQISMNVTAHRLNFSPFGRPDRERQNGEMSPMQSQPGSSAEMAMPFGAQMTQGQGSAGGSAEAGSLVDDEIPF